MVAALLVDDGFDGEALLSLAALSSRADGWDVDPLVPLALGEVGAPEMTAEVAADNVARLLAVSLPSRNYDVIRYLARLAPELDYPDGVIGRAYWLDEWLDCECHKSSVERTEAERFEDRLRDEGTRARMDLVATIFAS